MQVVDYLGEVFLRLVLARHVAELYALGGFHVDFRVRLAHAEGHEVAVSVHHLLRHILPDEEEDAYRDYPAKQNVEQRRHLLDYFAFELRSGVVETDHKPWVVERPCLVDVLFVLVGEYYLIALYLDAADFLVLRHRHKGPVVDILHLLLRDVRHREQVEAHQYQQGHPVIIVEGFFRFLYFVQFPALLSFCFLTQRNFIMPR